MGKQTKRWPHDKLPCESTCKRKTGKKKRTKSQNILPSLYHIPTWIRNLFGQISNQRMRMKSQSLVSQYPHFPKDTEHF
jgi:hypothetical protein